MAYRYGNREQMELFPASIESYVKEEDPVRAYDEFIEAIDLTKLGIELDDRKVGNSSYDPKAMLKILIYSYSYGWQSSRKIERALNHNISFIWLAGGIKPDHKTIAEFRRKNKKEIQKILKQSARMCIELELIEGNILFVDGTKIRANAGRGKNYTKEKYYEKMAGIDNRIERLLAKCEETDEREKDAGSLIKMKKEIRDKQVLKKKMEEIVKGFKEEDKAKRTINRTDPDSRIMKSIQGSHAAYNVQSVVDDKNGLIVSTDVVSKNNDREQFAKQIEQANEVLEEACKTACADAGYANTEELKKIDDQEIKVIVPTQEQVKRKEKEKPFSKEAFRYEEKTDRYYCPEGEMLKYETTNKENNHRKYRITSKKICQKCKYCGECTKDKKGRTISRLKDENIKEKIAKQYESEESQMIYKRRKERVEHPFGHIKKNLKMRQFLMRGKEGVLAEVALAATSFNLARMVNIFGGVQSFIGKVNSLRQNVC